MRPVGDDEPPATGAWQADDRAPRVFPGAHELDREPVVRMRARDESPVTVPTTSYQFLPGATAISRSRSLLGTT
jgi:hypothetical protein